MFMLCWTILACGGLFLGFSPRVPLLDFGAKFAMLDYC